ncbi:hypothetical protein GE09DRAFT_546206 [Coniochaeta sp. 2T2.1]|nr:hypothetical protein GE09DRAFT_546206 [Coniochaeta sp. 2T2.1]
MSGVGIHAWRQVTGGTWIRLRWHSAPENIRPGYLRHARRKSLAALGTLSDGIPHHGTSGKGKGCIPLRMLVTSSMLSGLLVMTSRRLWLACRVRYPLEIAQGARQSRHPQGLQYGLPAGGDFGFRSCPGPLKAAACLCGDKLCSCAEAINALLRGWAVLVSSFAQDFATALAAGMQFLVQVMLKT